MKALDWLRQHGIQPTPQRLAVAECILDNTSHPAADEVFEQVRVTCPTCSRATVYNTLNLLAEKGLIRPHALREGATVFDSNIGLHHHFIDDETGEIVDIPWDAIQVSGVDALADFDITEHQVVMHGRRRSR